TEGGDALQGGPPIELRPGREGIEPDDAQVRALADLEAMPEDEEETLRVVPTNPVVQAPAPAPRKAPAAREASSQFAFTDDGIYLVQLAAFRS
ncbi:MAG TPA: hypothetical protein DEB28_02945, partial [Hyphomonas sp.]